MASSDNYEYHGLMAAFWDLLRGDTSRWADRALYLEWIAESGQPVLDVGCGTGRLLLDYLAMGIDIDGVDNSPEMLDLLRGKAAGRGLSPSVYLQEMEALDLPRRYRTILVPSSSFQLLVDPAAARAALRRFYAHLEPGGLLVLPFYTNPRPEGMVGKLYVEDWNLSAEVLRPEDGATVRRWSQVTYDYAEQIEHTRDRYEVVRDGEVVESEEHARSPATRWYSQDQVFDLLAGARYVGQRFYAGFSRDFAGPDETLFTVVAARPPGPDPEQVSPLPIGAEARVTAQHPNGSPQRVEYRRNGKVVAERIYLEEGVLELHKEWRDGVEYLWAYRWDHPDWLLSVEPYRESLAHGVAYQWGVDGELHGAYALERGSGLDLWWSSCSDGSCPVTLGEVHSLQDGRWHGWEWWINEDQRSVYEERHWRLGQPHGIERQWNRAGRLRRGCPRYWVSGEQVTRRQYLRLAAGDSSLPPFRQADNDPAREFPAQVSRHLRKMT